MHQQDDPLRDGVNSVHQPDDPLRDGLLVRLFTKRIPFGTGSRRYSTQM